MTAATHRASGPTRLDRAIAWTGAGAATALSALLVMFGAFGFDSSRPRADNVGEESIGVAFGVIGWTFGLSVAVIAGWMLARNAERGRWWLRALPVLMSIAWMLLATAAIYGQWFEGVIFSAWPLFSGPAAVLSPSLWSLFVMSIYTFGAVPIGIVLFIGALALMILRMSRRRSERDPVVQLSQDAPIG